MKFIDEIELHEKTVFIRADLNVPLTDTGEIADDNRIRASVPTIKYALEHGAKVVLASHLGRPKGRDPKQSLRPVAKRLQEILGSPVVFADDCIGETVAAQAQSLKPGQVLLLENLRFHAEEEKNSLEFAKQLASLAGIYVNDAFATAHRAHASTAGIVQFISVSAGGFTLKDELGNFARAFKNPARPLVAIFGGAKVSEKILAIRNVATKADVIIVGGAMANTFFAADGISVGKSLFEADRLEVARETKQFLAERKCQLLLPVDVVVAAEMKAGAPKQTVDIQCIPPESMALDIGPKSAKLFSEAILSANTAIWNGPMGVFEIADFSAGTFAVVDALAETRAYTVVGGGDTDLALHQRHAYEKMGYVSTAGGAFLCLLEGSKLPAVEVLNNSARV